MCLTACHCPSLLRGSAPPQGEAAAECHSIPDLSGMSCGTQNSCQLTVWLWSQAAVRTSSLYSMRCTGFAPTSCPHFSELSCLWGVCSSIFVKEAVALRKGHKCGFWLPRAVACILHPAQTISALLIVTPRQQCGILYGAQNFS